MLRSRLIKALGISIAGTVLATGIAAPAKAAATAYNTRTMYLAYPTPDLATACWTRNIALASGTYKWGYVFKGHNDNAGSRNIYLTQATYSWRFCIDPEDGYYDFSSTLQVIVDVDPLPKAYLPVLAYSGSLIPGGTYTVGSYLDPYF
jgi:hypothetical protein